METVKSLLEERKEEFRKYCEESGMQLKEPSPNYEERLREWRESNLVMTRNQPRWAKVRNEWPEVTEGAEASSIFPPGTVIREYEE